MEVGLDPATDGPGLYEFAVSHHLHHLHRTGEGPFYRRFIKDALKPDGRLVVVDNAGTVVQDGQLP